MAVRVLVIVLLLVTQVVSAHRFEDYQVARVYHGHLARPNLRSAPGASHFRTVLREGAREGANFAGHFAVVTWGCGTSCQSLAIVDVRSGRVFFPLRDVLEMGAEFKINSRLLVTDPLTAWREVAPDFGPDGLPARAWARYYEWRDTALVLLDSVSARQMVR
jgi:hypothetical protein